MTTSTCNCAELYDALSLEEWEQAGVEFKKTSHTHWSETVACNECGQVWKLDIPFDRYQTLLALRICDRDDLDAHHEEMLRMSYLLRSQGGASAEKCKFQGCDRMAMRKSAFCVECAYHRCGQRS